MFTLQQLRTIVALFLGMLLASCSLTYDATGYISGKPVHFQVDSRLAQLMIEDSTHIAVQKLYQKYKNYELNTQTLTEIAEKYSIDVSALYFLYRIYKDTSNKTAFDQFNQIVYHSTPSSVEQRMQKLQKFHFVFIPGFFYKTFPFSGADFKTQRNLFDSHGVSYDFIETGEKDPVDMNASYIHSKLLEIQKNHTNLIVVSASKGGLEAANVLGKYNDLNSVKAWVSVCGILRGCPITDIFNSFPNYIVGPIMFRIKHINPEPYKNFDSDRRKFEYNSLNLPKDLLILHYLGVPMASNVNDKIKFRYNLMKKYGANDGSCPVTEQLTDQGIVIADPGLDHYLKDIKIIEKTIALFEITVDMIDQKSTVLMTENY